MKPDLKQFEHLKIQLQDIISATNNFADNNCVGRGGFGKVYKGELVHSKGQSMVALKRLDREYGQGDPEFWKEIMTLSLYKHENIVSLFGFCDDSGERILVYEYMSKGSLDRYLKSDDLTWVRRLKICIGAAHGLAYLHNPNETQLRVLHRDIKSSNILLDEKWNAKISDFGLSKFGPTNQQFTFLFSNAVGTVGYCDPLYVETGLLTKESDVYSFGIVLFEVLCGRLCMVNINNKHQPLTGLVRECYRHNKIDEIIHCTIKDQIDPNSLNEFTTIAYQCLKREREERPSMAEIVRVLETALKYQRDHEERSLITEIVGGLETSIEYQEAERPPSRFCEWDVNDPALAEGFTIIFNKARNEKKASQTTDSPPKSDSTDHKPASTTLGKPQREVERPLPKFGDWDVYDPASIEGFTVIFNKARDEKKAGGTADSPPKSDSTHGASTLGKPQFKKWFCFTE